MLKKTALLLMALACLAARPSADRYDLLTVTASVVPKRMQRGQEGELRLRFRIRPGITINSQPEFIIEVRPSDALSFPKAFYSASDLEMKIIEEEGRQFLDMTGVLAIPFTVKLEAQRGNHAVRGRVRYFGSAHEQGWTLKHKTTFSASFYTSSRLFRR